MRTDATPRFLLEPTGDPDFPGASYSQRIVDTRAEPAFRVSYQCSAADAPAMLADHNARPDLWAYPYSRA